jgi:hypothetical protein
VGSAEGYYAVGFPRTFPETPVYSFDVAPFARAQKRRFAKLNDVVNLKIGKYCRHRDLDRLLGHRSLLVCDIEGFEVHLLDPKKSRSLAGADILVEIHKMGNMSSDEVKQEMITRFSNSYEIKTIPICERDLVLYEKEVCRNRLSYQEIKECVDEYRSMDQCWLWMNAHVE